MDTNKKKCESLYDGVINFVDKVFKHIKSPLAKAASQENYEKWSAVLEGHKQKR